MENFIEEFEIDYNYVMEHAAITGNLKLFITAIDIINSRRVNSFKMSMENSYNSNNIHIMKYILDNYRKYINIQDYIYLSIFENKLTILEFLIKYESINTNNCNNIFPDVIYKCNKPIINFLLNNNIITANDIYNQLWDYNKAADAKKLKYIEILLNRGSYPPNDIADYFIIGAYFNNRFDILKTLLIENKIKLDISKLIQYDYCLKDYQKNFFIEYFKHPQTKLLINTSEPIILYEIHNSNVGTILTYLSDPSDICSFDKFLINTFASK
jgi:hypothetical protein